MCMKPEVKCLEHDRFFFFKGENPRTLDLKFPDVSLNSLALKYNYAKLQMHKIN